MVCLSKNATAVCIWGAWSGFDQQVVDITTCTCMTDIITVYEFTK